MGKHKLSITLFLIVILTFLTTSNVNAEDTITHCVNDDDIALQWLNPNSSSYYLTLTCKDFKEKIYSNYIQDSNYSANQKYWLYTTGMMWDGTTKWHYDDKHNYVINFYPVSMTNLDYPYYDTTNKNVVINREYTNYRLDLKKDGTIGTFEDTFLNRIVSTTNISLPYYSTIVIDSYFDDAKTKNITIDTTPLEYNNSNRPKDWLYIIDNNSSSYYTSAKMLTINNVKYNEIEEKLSNIKLAHCNIANNDNPTYDECIASFNADSTYIDYEIYYDSNYEQLATLPFNPNADNYNFYALPLEFPQYETYLSYNEDSNKLIFNFKFNSWVNNKIVGFVSTTETNVNYNINYSKYLNNNIYSFSVKTGEEISIKFSYNYNTDNILKTDVFDIEGMINKDENEGLRNNLIINDSDSNSGNLEGFSGISGVFKWATNIFNSISTFMNAVKEIVLYLYKKLNSTIRITILFVFINALLQGVIKTIQRRS